MAVVKIKKAYSTPKNINLLKAIMICMNWQDIWIAGHNRFVLPSFAYLGIV